MFSHAVVLRVLKYMQLTVKPRYTDTSLLRQTVCFVPGERKPLRFLHIQPA